MVKANAMNKAKEMPCLYSPKRLRIYLGYMATVQWIDAEPLTGILFLPDWNYRENFAILTNDDGVIRSVKFDGAEQVSNIGAKVL